MRHGNESKSKSKSKSKSESSRCNQIDRWAEEGSLLMTEQPVTWHAAEVEAPELAVEPLRMVDESCPEDTLGLLILDFEARRGMKLQMEY